VDRPHQGAEKERRKMTEKEHSYFIRLSYFHRMMHAIVMISFLGLALTGIPVKYSDRSWAHYLVYFMGGFQAAGYFHRLFALVTFGYFFTHLIYLVHFFKCKSTKPFFTFVFGPESMVPQLKDFKDLCNNVKWFIGFGPRPRFDRWTYWEKFDYWAVFWGVAMIGISGLFLWFPMFFARFFPGWVLNVATIVHSDEALLATGFIFIFHFIHTHLRGEKFPLDTVVFTGRITEEEFRKERPIEYERLQREDRLEMIQTDPPPLWLKNMARIVGFAALSVGVFIIILVIGTFFN
jgi:cytochrome b subunit of formate dehydrogenase